VRGKTIFLHIPEEQEQGDQMSLCTKSPKIWPNPFFCQNYYTTKKRKSNPILYAFLVIFKKQLKVNNKGKITQPGHPARE
jgi:hypothetical protein